MLNYLPNAIDCVDMSKELAMGLKELRKRISSSNVPSSKLDETINIATWNIREFGKKPRMRESLHFIAEIMNEFDLIAVIELRDNLEDLGYVLNVLGPYGGLSIRTTSLMPAATMSV